MQRCRKVEDRSQGIRQSKLPGQGESLAVPLQGLLRVAQQAQDPCRIGQVDDARVIAMEKGQGAVLLRRIKGHLRRQMLAGAGQVAEQERAHPHPEAGLHQERRVTDALSQAQELLANLTRWPILRPGRVKPSQPLQYHSELRRLPDLLTQRAGPVIGLCHVRTRQALDGYQRRAQGTPQVDFVSDAFGSEYSTA